MYTNIGLVEYAKKQLNIPNYYIYGTFGRILTKSLVEQKIAQYPSFYNTETRRKNARAKADKGIKGFDCVGLIKGYIWDDGRVYNVPRGSDQNTLGMFNSAKVKGTINTLNRNQVGQIVYMQGHVGIHIGNGEVIESTIGWNAYKIIKTKLSDRNWTSWFEYPFIQYISSTPQTISKTTVHLPRTVETWRIYGLNVSPTVGNEIAFLKPSKFGGLTYEVLEWRVPNTIAIIQTRDYGKVQIYVGSDTSAIIKTESIEPPKAEIPKVETDKEKISKLEKNIFELEKIIKGQEIEIDELEKELGKFKKIEAYIKEK